MARVSDVVAALELIAPTRWALSFDRVGLQVGDPEAPVGKCAVSLDWSDAAIEYCIQNDCQMLVSHHPLLFSPPSTVIASDHIGNAILKLARHSIAFAAAHTNWDAAPGGINDTLAAIIGLRQVVPFGGYAETKNLKVVTFVPTTHADTLINAASREGAGEVGNYRNCAFSSQGTGSFSPSGSATPFTDSPVEEVRIEMALPEYRRGQVEAALRQTHPYEEPVIDFYALETRPEMPLARIGKLDQPMTLADFSTHVETRLETHAQTWGRPDLEIHQVALSGGAADSEWRAAKQAGAQVFLTGEVKQHVAIEATSAGVAIVAAGHFATENPGCRALAKALNRACPDVEFQFWEPTAGEAGRPLPSSSRLI